MKPILWPFVALVIGIVCGVFGERAWHANDLLAIFRQHVSFTDQGAFAVSTVSSVQGDLEENLAGLIGEHRASLYHPILIPEGAGYEIYLFARPGTPPLEDVLVTKLHDYISDRLQHHESEFRKAQASQRLKPD